MATLLGNCSYAGIPFDIEASDAAGWYPVPVLTEDGRTIMQLVVLFDSHADWVDFKSLQSKVDFRATLGSLGGVAYVQAGPGSKTLSIPTGSTGNNQNHYAILVAASPQRHGWDSGLYRVDATWVIVT